MKNGATVIKGWIILLGVLLCAAAVPGTAMAGPIAFSTGGGAITPLLGTTRPATVTCPDDPVCSPDTVTLNSLSGSYTADGTYALSLFTFTVRNSHAPHGDYAVDIAQTLTIGGFSTTLDVLATLTVTSLGDYLQITGGSAQIDDTDTHQNFIVSVLPSAQIGYVGDDNHDPHGRMVGLTLYATFATSSDHQLGQDSVLFSHLAGDETAAPEPAALALFGAGLAGLGLLRRRAARQD